MSVTKKKQRLRWQVQFDLHLVAQEILPEWHPHCEFQNGRSTRPRTRDRVNNHGGIGRAHLGYHNDA